MLCFIAWKAQRKTIKLIKVFCIKCTPATDLVKGIVMAHNKSCLLVRHADYQLSGWLVDPK